MGLYPTMLKGSLTAMQQGELYYARKRRRERESVTPPEFNRQQPDQIGVVVGVVLTTTPRWWFGHCIPGVTMHATLTTA